MVIVRAIYTVAIRRQGAKALQGMPREQAERVSGALDKLAENPSRPDIDVAPLIGRPGFRLRVGGLRIIFKRDDAARVIEVTRIVSRGQAYRKR